MTFKLIPVRQTGEGSVPRRISKALLRRFGIKKLEIGLAEKPTVEQFQTIKHGLRAISPDGTPFRANQKEVPSSMKALVATLNDETNLTVRYGLRFESGRTTVSEPVLHSRNLASSRGGYDGKTTRQSFSEDRLLFSADGWRLALLDGKYSFDLVCGTEENGPFKVRSIAFDSQGFSLSRIYGYQAHRLTGTDRIVVQPADSVTGLINGNIRQEQSSQNDHLNFCEPWFWVWNTEAFAEKGVITELRLVGFRYAETGDNGVNGRDRAFQHLYLTTDTDPAKELLIKPAKS
ncbi:MAG: hypothetical protein ABIE84_05795 [bacterium]